jgi:hypothetical protein
MYDILIDVVEIRIIPLASKKAEKRGISIDKYWSKE